VEYDSTRMAKVARKRSRSRKMLAVAVSLGALLGLLLLVEAGVRVRQWVKYGTLSATFYQLEMHAASGLEIPAPGSSVGTVRVNSLGFRGPEIELPKPPGRIRVAFLGGSTTFCAETSGLEATWPYLVAQGLTEAFPDASIDQVNGAAGGYSTRQSALNLEHRVAPLDPDVVVVYHGTNDLTQDSREVAARLGLFDPEVLEQDVLGRYSLAWYLVLKNVRAWQRKQPSDAERLEVDPATYSGAFHERLRALVEQAQETADLVVLVTFSHRVRAGMEPEELREACATSLLYMPYMTAEGVLAGFDEYNRVVRRVAQETGALLVDGEDSIPGNAAHFADSVHLTNAGCRLQAKRVLEALTVSEAFRALVAGRSDQRENR